MVETRRSPRLSLSLWINRLLILVAVGIVATVATQAYMSLQALPVQQITVTGELAHTQRDAVQALVQPALVGGFLKADLEGIRAELEAMPWVFEANVRRKWPASLEIHVVEQLPIARWGEQGFLNHEGGIFHSERGAQWQELPLLSGPEGTARPLMATYRRMVDILSPLGLAIRELAVDERGQVEAVLDGGVTVALGSREFLPRIQRFVQLYRRELAPRARELARVDLRYATGVAVAFNEAVEETGS